MELIAGYIAAGLIGISLGLIGGGGSIITIPILVYLFHIEPVLATTYSLFIVGTTSVAGGLRSFFHQEADLGKAVLFSIPSIIAVFFSRHFLLSSIPENIALVNDLVLTSDTIVMILFSVVMIVASLGMIRNSDRKYTRPLFTGKFTVIIAGFLVGILTGLIGAGGGFLIIPVLIIVDRMPVKKAIGTSLIVISINSLVGFFGDLRLVRNIDFPLMLWITAIALIGVFFGQFGSRYIPTDKLKTGFGWFSLTMGVFIVVKEIIF